MYTNEYNQEVLDRYTLMQEYYTTLTKCRELQEKIDKLPLKSANELYLKLPCRIGDTVWNISYGQVYKAKVVCIRPFVFKDHVEYRGNAVITMQYPFYLDGRQLEQEVFIIFDKDTFFTQEDAIKALNAKITSIEV